MTYLNRRLVVLCLSAACGGGGGGGDPDGGARADSGPDPSCDESELPVAWSTSLESPKNPISFDTDGSLLIAVSRMGGEPWYCAGLARLAGDGDEVWRHPYDPSPPPAENYAPCPSWWNGIALASNGAIVTIGDDVTGDPEGATDVVLRKHDGNGDQLWTYYNQNAPDGLEGSDRAADVAVDPDGFVVAAGTVASRAWVGRFAPNGDPDWIWSGSTSGEDAVDVEGAADGTAFVGIATGPEATPYRIARFDPAGTETTIAEMSRQATLNITPDGGLLFVAGATEPLLRKIDASGEVVWEQPLAIQIEDEHCHSDRGSPASIAIDPEGSIYLTLSGRYENTDDPEFPSTEEFTALARFSPEGELLSTHLLEVNDPGVLEIGPGGEIAMIVGERLVVAAPLDGGG